MRELVIAGRRIADDTPAYVVAEIGGNHGGSVETAREMIRSAAACGADAVKLQKRDNATLYTSALLAKPYDHEQSYGPTYGAHREALEFGRVQYLQCQDEAVKARIPLFATAFDERSADFLAGLSVPAIKLASGSLTDLRLIRYVAKYHQPIILSTGGGTMTDIDRAVETVREFHHQLAVLHCTASYPCAFTELNLRVILALRTRFPDLVIGWSGHDSGIAMAMVAYAFGARIIEKHFTLNRSMKGTDHAFSLEPAGLRKLTRDLQRAHVAVGDGIKQFYQSEVAPIAKMRRVDTSEGWKISG